MNTMSRVEMISSRSRILNSPLSWPSKWVPISVQTLYFAPTKNRLKCDVQNTQQTFWSSKFIGTCVFRVPWRQNSKRNPLFFPEFSRKFSIWADITQYWEFRNNSIVVLYDDLNSARKPLYPWLFVYNSPRTANLPINCSRVCGIPCSTFWTSFALFGLWSVIMSMKNLKN